MAEEGKVKILIDLITDSVEKGLDRIEEEIDNLGDKFNERFGIIGRGLDNLGRRFMDVGERMVDAGENMSQALALPFLAIGTAAVMAARKVREGEKEWNKFTKNVESLQKALAPLGVILLRFANEYMPKLTAVVKEIVTRFAKLDKSTQKWVIAISALAVAIGPVIMFVGALGLAFGGLISLMGMLLSPAALAAGAIVGLGAAAIKSLGGMDFLRGKLEQLRAKAKEVEKAFNTLKTRLKEALNFEDLGMTFGPILRTLVRAIQNGDPQMIGYALAALINRGVEVLRNAVGLINWQAVAIAIANGLVRIGQYASIIIPPVVQALSNVFQQIPWQQIAAVIGQQAGRIVPPLAQALAIIIRTLAQNLGPIIPALIQLGIALALAFVDAVFDPATWIPIIQTHGWDLLVTGLSLIFLPGRILGIIGQLLGKIPLAGRLLQWLWDALVKLAGPARERVYQKFGEIWDAIKKPLGEKWQKVKERGRQLLQEAVDDWKLKMRAGLTMLWNQAKGWVSSGVNRALSGHAGKFTKAAQEWINKLRSSLASLPGKMRTWGRNAVQGLVNGLSSMLGKVASIAKKIANTVKQYVGWQSPTEKGPGRDSDKWAPNFMKMFVGGLRAGIPDVRRVVLDVAANVNPTMAVSSPQAPAKPAPTVIVNNHGRDLTGWDVVNALRRREWLDA
jgi:hypothetical protein